MIVYEQTPEDINEEFCMSCRQGNLEAVIELIEKYKADINYDSQYGLKKACSIGHYDVAVYLINHPDSKKDNLVDLFSEACMSPSLKLVKYISDLPGFPSVWSEDLDLGLITSAVYKRKETFQFLVVEKNALLNKENLIDIKSYFRNTSDGLKWINEIKGKIDSKSRYDSLNASVFNKTDSINRKKKI